jgi:nucleotide-binding universal stress UspA family protein
LEPVPLAVAGAAVVTPPPPPFDPQALARSAEDSLEQTLKAVFGADLPSNLTRSVVEGNPGGVLVDRSRDADLLVVGSRGKGGFAGLLLGSVSEKCVRHAACTVVVVRP